MKSVWEVTLRRLIRLPKHSTGNDGAVLLLHAAALVVIVAIIVVLCAPWVIGHLVMFSASPFVGLALQQYAWYTGRIYAECWNDEGVPVLLTVGMSSVLIGVLSLLFYVLLMGHGLLKIVLIGGVHLAILSSWRWAIWGSLFDVRRLAPSHSLATITACALHCPMHASRIANVDSCAACVCARRGKTSCATRKEHPYASSAAGTRH